MNKLSRHKRWRWKYLQQHGVAYATQWARKNRKVTHPRKRCKECKQWFRPYRLSVKFCSRKCNRTYFNRKRAKKERHIAKHRERVECDFCYNLYRQRNLKQRYCSYDCQLAMAEQVRLLRRHLTLM